MSQTRALIFANGQHANLGVLRAWVRPDDLLIAADGGLRYLRALGLKPALVIGDLDSLAEGELEQLRQAGVELRQYPVDKNETDLELALAAALQAGAREIWVVAALGGRLDMTLASIFLLMLPELAGAAVRLEDGYDSVFLIRPGQPGQVRGQPGQRLSLLPLNGPARGIHTEGLAYPLDGETLWPERSRGISNRLQSAAAQITLQEGLLLCIHTHHTQQITAEIT